MALVQKAKLHHAASEHMVHTCYGVSTPTELEGLQMMDLGGRTLVRLGNLKKMLGIGHESQQ